MPAGLDGNPDPVRTRERDAVLSVVADRIAALHADPDAGRRPTLVGVDGIDGSGKSTFADELKAKLAERGIRVVRSTVDSFHHPRSIRWRKGPRSPIGFYTDSHDLNTLRQRLLDPFRSGRGATYQVAAFDEPSDQPVDPPTETVDGDEVLLFDGIFLLRPELSDYWDLSVFLDGRDRVSLDRLGLILDDCPDGPDALHHILTWVARIDRYSAGMGIYLDQVDPISIADIVIDNNNLAAPRIA